MTRDSATHSFAAMPQPSEAGTFTAEELSPRQWLGKDSKGRPCVIIEVRPTGARLRPQRLRHLEAVHGVACALSGSHAPQPIAAATIVTCSSDDRHVRDFFVRGAADVVALVGCMPTDAECAAAVAGLADLFSPQGRHRAAQGLWAELLFAAEAADPAAAIAAWHPKATDLFDYESRGVRIEVKSTTAPRRQHHFRLEQLRPNDGNSPFVVSILLQPSATGCSLVDLAAEVKGSTLDPRRRLQIDTEVLAAEAAGCTAAEVRFDRKAAVEGMRLYSAATLPAPTAPAGVAEVRFAADITQHARLAWEALPSELRPLAWGGPTSIEALG